MSHEILIVDDDRFLVDAIRKLLLQHHFSVRSAHRAEDAVKAVGDMAPDLLILDLNLPDGDGVTLCRRLRMDHRFPIIMLTSRSDTMSKVIGLEVGADDYLPKPFDANELLARVRAHLRRAQEYQVRGQTPVKTFGCLEIDEDARKVLVSGRAIELTSMEYMILTYLAANAGRALSNEQIFLAVWGYDMDTSSNTLNVLISRLRRKLEGAGGDKLIRTIRGYGFSFGSS